MITTNLLTKAIWKVLHHDRVDSKQNPLSRAECLGNLVQRLFESEYAKYIPGLKAKDSHDYSLSHADKLDKEFTQKRVACKKSFIEHLSGFMPSEAKDMSLIELGCADCANLLLLLKNGFKNLSGVEINGKFIEAGRIYDNDAISRMDVKNVSLEEYLSKPEKKYDIVLTCAVLQHVNPESFEVFNKIRDICEKYLVTVEAESQCNMIHYPRNYQRLMEKRGFKQLKSSLITKESFGENFEGTVGYMMRLFKRSDE